LVGSEADRALSDSKLASAGHRILLTDVVTVRMVVLGLQDEVDSSVKIAQSSLNFLLGLTPEALYVVELAIKSAG
jgi:hypothetical protein